MKISKVLLFAMTLTMCFAMNVSAGNKVLNYNEQTIDFFSGNVRSCVQNTDLVPQYCGQVILMEIGRKHNISTLSGDHGGKESPGMQESTFYMDRKKLIPGIGGHVLHKACPGGAGIVDEGIQVPEGFQHRFGCCQHLLLIPLVAADGQGTGFPGQGSGGFFAVEIGEGHPPSAGGKLTDDPGTDAPGSAGDKRCFHGNSFFVYKKGL